MSTQTKPRKEVRAALRKVAKRICYKCGIAKPYRRTRFAPDDAGTPRYIHLRTEKMSTSLHPGDDCLAPEVWREYEAAGGKVKTTDE